MRRLLIILLSLVAIQANAQSDREYIRQGNRLYRSGNYVKAEVMYRKALAKNSSNTQAIYNLGCAMMMQKKDSASVVQFQKAAKMEKSKMRRAMAMHNIGVICQSHKMYGDAIQAYKQSLRDNPHDNQTRYNLALCKKLNKQSPQNKNNKNQKKDKDSKGQDRHQNKNKQEQEQNPNKQGQPQMSKENAEQLLNAAVQAEKATQERLQKATRQPQRRDMPKNW